MSLRPVEDAMRSVVNSVFMGKDSYEVLKTCVICAVCIRVWRRVARIHSRVGLRRYLLAIVLPWLRMLPPVRRELEKQMSGARRDMEKTLLKDITQRQTQLPAEGRSVSDILQLMEQRLELDTKYWKDGKITGAIYHGEKEHMEMVGKVYGMFAYCNPLHAGIHPSTRQMDAEVVQMVCKMYNGNEDACGAFMTGGTESILMAMKAYRDWGRTRGIEECNVICPITAHAAIDKAGQYFGIHIRHARVIPETQAVDINHVRRLMDSNTVALFGSAPQYPHGTVDDIEGLSALAQRYNTGLHVDCCLGGFLVPFMEKAGFSIRPFDFRVSGVTSISCDPHKYGFAPKGSSVVMFRNGQWRRHMYSFFTEWTGGIYATAGVLGSRPGGPVAATWAAMMKQGEAGYVDTTRKIVGATRKIAKGVEAIEGIRLVGKPDVCVVAFTGVDGINCYNIGDWMKKERGWELASCQNPPCVHLAVTLPSAANADSFIADLDECVSMMRAEPEKHKGGTAGLYGTAASVPPEITQEVVGIYLDTASKATAPEHELQHNDKIA